MVKNLPANAGDIRDAGSVPGSGRSPGAMNIGVHVSLSILLSLVCMPSSGIAGSYGSP